MLSNHIETYSFKLLYRKIINDFVYFFSDLDDMSREVKFEVFDREKPPGGEFTCCTN